MLAPAEQLTIVHCDDPSRAEELAAFLQNWAEAGLLLADLWVVSGADPETWAVRPVGLVDSYNYAVARTSGEDQLGEAMAAREFLLFRLVHLVFAGDGEAGDTRGWEAVSTFMRDRLRHNVASLQLVNLIVPRSHQPTSLPRTLLRPDANLNLVAAPEDSRSSRMSWLPFTDQAGDGPRETTGWGAVMAAALAGVWTGVEANPLDGTPPALIDGEPTVRVGRAFVRVLDGGFLIDHIGAGLIGRFDEWPYPSDLERPDDLLVERGSAVEDIAKAFTHIDSGALRFNRVPLPAKSPPKEITWWAAFLMMFQFIADAVRRSPTAFVTGIVERGKARAARWAQKAVFGEDSAFLVTFGGHRGDGSYEGDPPATTQDVRATAERIYALLDGRTPPTPSPDAWRALRRLILGLGDGGTLPDVGDPSIPTLTKQGPNQLLVRSPERLVPDPAAMTLPLQAELFRRGGPLAAWDQDALRVCDPLTCWQMSGSLTRAEALLETEAGEPAPALRDETPSDSLSADNRLAPAERESDEDQLPSPPGSDDGGPPPGEDGPEVSIRDSEPSQLSDPNGQRRNIYHQAKATIREFVTRQRQSLMWNIAENVTGELLDAIREYERTIAIVSEGRPEFDDTEAKVARKRLRRRWLLIGVLAVAVMLGGWLLIPVTLLLMGPLALVGMVIGWSRAFLAYHRTMFQLQHRQAERYDRYDHAEESALRSSYEILKLLDRYAELMDWAEILGGFVHRPWGQSAKLTPSTVEMELAGVPRAFTVASGFVKEEKVKSLRARALRDIIRSRWLNNQFDKVVDGVLDQFAEEHGLRRDRDVSEPEEDTRRGDVSSREALRNAILKGDYSAAARREMEAQVRDFSSRIAPSEIFEFARVELRPDEVPAKVSTKGRALEAGDTGIRLSPLTNPAGAGQLDVSGVVRGVLPSVVHILVEEASGTSSGSGVVLNRDGFIVTNAHVVGTAASVEVSFADGAVVTGEVVMSKPEEDLAVVKVDHAGLTPARRQRTELLQVGEAVLAVGNPVGLAGGPSVTLGIVSAVNRTGHFEDHTLKGLIQTDAAISPGSSGGGLFDAAGEFVGIPTGGRLDAENIGFAISAQRALAVVGTVAGANSPPPDEADIEPDVGGSEDQVRPQGMAYTDMDVFFAELAPGAGEDFGTGSCWPPSPEPLGKPERSIIWSPGVVSEIGGPDVERAPLRPPIQLGRKLVYAACRLDLTRPVTGRQLLQFRDDSDVDDSTDGRASAAGKKQQGTPSNGAQGIA